MNETAATTGIPLTRILLLEDDPVSAAFLAAALEMLPAQVDLVGSLADARALMHGTSHDLWLFDANLPDGRSADLLAQLRARGLRTTALAHTADARKDELDALIDAGFEEVLLKPLSVAQLQGTVRRILGAPSAENSLAPTMPVHCGKLPIWDDDAALRALNGHHAHVETMRGLFLQELPKTAARVTAAVAAADLVTLRAELHKLQAACGFVGAARLAAAVVALRDSPASVHAAAQFDGAAQDTLSSAG